MKNNLFLAFSNKQYLYLWLGEIFTQIPVNLLNFLLILVIFKLTRSNTAVSVIVLSFTLPAVFLGIVAGVYTDKWNKKKVLYISNILRVILVLILALFNSSIYVIYIISFLFGIITQFFIPAETPIIPLIVTESQLLSANALFGIGIYGSIMVAYLFSGPLLLYAGFVPTLIILAIMIFIGGFFISHIQVPPSEEKKKFDIGKRLPLSEVSKEVLAVWNMIRSKEGILTSLILLALSQIFILTIAAIAPGFASEVLHIKIEQFPLLVITPAAAGIICGALFITNKLTNVRKKTIITVGIFLCGLVLALMPQTSKIASRNITLIINTFLPEFLHITNIHLVAAMSFILGIANSLIFIPANTFLQEKTSDETRGKVYGVLNTIIGVLSFTPILLVGSFSDLIGVGRVLTFVGFSLLGVAVVGYFYTRK
jgi:MFS family permease